ncbi:MAG: NTP transferase domain-containing protein [Gammaproteobacteria bacterium]
MTRLGTPLPAIVLAGERPGGNALARALGIEAGVLAPVAGRTCVERVLAALRASESVRGGLLVGPRAEVRARSAVIAVLLERGDFAWLAPADGPAASAATAFAALADRPVLLTSGDHALLTPAIVDTFCTRAQALEADLVTGLVAWDAVRAAWPESRRTLLRFADGACCGSNLFLLRTPRAAAALAFWRGVEHDRKRPWRIARRLGGAALLRYLGGRLTRDAAFALLSRRAGATIVPLMLNAPCAAVDVDSLADRELAERIIRAREQAPS